MLPYETFAALADPTRTAIVEVLSHGERSSSQIAAALELKQPRASQHLRVLREAGVVDVRPRAQERIYSLHPTALVAAADWLSRRAAAWSERLDNLDNVLRQGAVDADHGA